MTAVDVRRTPLRPVSEPSPIEIKFRCIGDDWPDADRSDWVIDGLVCDTLTVLSGPPKSRKTWFAGHIARSVVTGESLLGFRVNFPGPVFVISTDLGDARQWKKRWGHQSWVSDLYAVEADASEMTDAWWAEVHKHLSYSSAGLLVIDNLNGIAGTSDTDKGDGARKVLAPLMRIAHEVPTLLIAHHGKSGRGPAHSYVTSAQLRHGVAITEDSASAVKTLRLSGNLAPPRRLRVRIDLADRCELLSEGSPDTDAPRRSAAGKASRPDPSFLAEVRAIHEGGSLPCSQSEAGRRIVAAGLKDTAEGGRSAVRRLLQGSRGQQFVRAGEGGQVDLTPLAVETLGAHSPDVPEGLL